MRPRSWRRAFGAWLVGMVMVCAALPSVEVVFGADRQKQALVLYSTRRDAQIAVVGDRDLPLILEEGLNEGVDYYSEYLDQQRFPDTEYRTAFADFLRIKYQGHRFDVVIAMSDIAVQFIDGSRDDLLRDIPIVFFSNTPIVPRPANSTGVVAELNLADTVALAARLQPNLRRVFVVSGAEVSDKQYERQARAQLQQFEPQLAVTYLSGLPTKELESRLATLPADSMVYFLLVSQDGGGEFFHPLMYVDRVVNAASVPTYSWVDSVMNHGVVGGSLKSQEAETAAVGALALRVLRGESADSIPPRSLDLNVRQVDWRQLQRWGISEGRIPAGTRVRFREPSGWDRYKGYIVGAAALMVAQAILIGGLLVQASRRRKAEAQLRESQSELNKAYARLMSAEEAERSRIARDLHDDIGQRMAALTMNLDRLHDKGPVTVTDWRTQIEGLSNNALELARDIQSMSRVLHSSNVDYLGLTLASAGFCRELSKQQKIQIHFSSDDLPGDLPQRVAHSVFRVLQEAVHNAIKHSGARNITVALRATARDIELDVVDDGMGFDLARATTGQGLGLISMRERIRLEGGELLIESRPGAGATVRAHVPLTGSGLTMQAVG